jgi:hypothetical protein
LNFVVKDIYIYIYTGLNFSCQLLLTLARKLCYLAFDFFILTFKKYYKMFHISCQHKMLDTKLSHQPIHKNWKNKNPIIFKKIKIEYLITILKKFYIPYHPKVSFVIKWSWKWWNEDMWEYEVDMLKIIIGYTPNNFATHTTQYYSQWWKIK